MRFGVMAGAERGDLNRKIAGLCADAQWAEAAMLDTVWVPQVPNDFDALTALTLMGAKTTRIELGTAVIPMQAQHPIALARQALSVHGATSARLALGVGPSHHWVVSDMLGLPYQRPASYARDYLAVLAEALSGKGSVDVDNETFHVHNPFALKPVDAMPVLLAALGPRMLTLAGEQADGTILWMADVRAVADHVVPHIAKAAERVGRPHPRVIAGIPVCLCSNTDIPVARERANQVLGEAEVSPNYQRLLEHGDADNVGDICVAGDAEALLKQFRRFADAGVTDLAVRLLPIGDSREQLVASKKRTRDVVSALAREFR